VSAFDRWVIVLAAVVFSAVVGFLLAWWLHATDGLPGQGG
jgi:hypothetical protein